MSAMDNGGHRSAGGNRWAEPEKPRSTGGNRWADSGGQKAQVGEQKPEVGGEKAAGDSWRPPVEKHDQFTYGPVTRDMGMARLVMIGFGGLLLFVGAILLGLNHKDAGYAQSSLEINTQGEIEVLKKELEHVRSTAEKEKIRLQIAAVEANGREVDPAVLEGLAKKRMEALVYMLAGAVMLVSFFTASAHPKGSTVAALLASLSLIPMILVLLAHTDTSTRTLIHAANYEVRVQKVYHTGLAMALPLMGAIYVLWRGMLAGRVLAERKGIKN